LFRCWQYDDGYAIYFTVHRNFRKLFGRICAKLVWMDFCYYFCHGISLLARLGTNWRYIWSEKNINFVCNRTSYFRFINGVCYFRMAAFFITVYFRRIYRVRTYVTSAYIYTNTKGNGGKSSWYTANRKCNWNINGATSRWSYC